MTKDELIAVIKSADFNNAVQEAVEEALDERVGTPHVFVKTADDPAVYVVTPFGLLHVEDPTHFSRLSGRKPIGEAVLTVSRDWLDMHAAHEG